ncbi:ABC transporter ATP-binding protein [Sulfitobacter sp. EE-36]|uniref:ABC transporter ATP-binding protein n=1 Tax=Sulfitobacter TaxID=60136 RepID=UPI000066AA13|nr:ABC transporter ATP-binding protein [Sulfitobacter sp. EE-36]EAP84777.1 ABC cobalamin/Fe3+-siderophore transporter, ATPase subunit [Sulfitobacter sp. EE-36]
MTLLSLQNLSVHRGRKTVLSDINLTLREGEVVGLVGPNGAGKTTLMRAALGLIPADGQSSIAALAPRMRGRAAAWMPQSREIAWPVTVETIIRLGRTPHLRGGQKIQAEDQAAVDRAIAQMDLDTFRNRPATQLSGGEQARVLIARSLAQEAPLLIADEPTAGLDPAHQIAAMESFSKAAGQGRGVLVSLHDLGLAARHCTRLIVLHNGAVVADDVPQAALTTEIVEAVFGITAFSEVTDKGFVFQPLEVVS